MKRVFLGGTCASNHWREEIAIPGLLERGVDLEQIFNPVVLHWDEAAQAREDAAKADPDCLLLFVLASPDPACDEVREVSGYSIFEAIMACYDAPERTAVLVETTGQAHKTAKGMRKGLADLMRRFPGMPIFIGEWSGMLDYVADHLEREQ